MYFIYQITNTTNNKLYIGQTNNSDLRWSQHKSNAKYNKGGQVVTRAMVKYGVDAFKFDVIATCKSQEDVNQTEAQLIKQYDTRNPFKGYNVDVGGFVSPRPAEIGLRISDSLKKHYETHDSKRKGTTVSEDVKKKMSESAMGKAGTNEGKTFDNEWRLAIAKSRTGVESKAHRRFSDEVEKEICRLYVEEEMSGYALGKKFDCSGSVIRDILKRNNIVSRKSNYTGHSNGKNIFTIEKELEICELYKGGTVSRRELAIKYSCGKTTIRDILIRNEIR
jgi:group I intron endonuclease